MPVRFRAMSSAQLVLVHGFTHTGASWAPLTPALQAAGFDVTTPDVPVAPDLWAALGKQTALVEAGGMLTRDDDALLSQVHARLKDKPA